MRDYLKKRWIFFVLSLLVYAVLFVFIARVSGHGTATTGLVPVLIAGLCWGWTGGLLAGVLSFPVSMLMMILCGLDWKPGMLSGGGIAGYIGFLIVGVFTGYMRDLYMQRQQAYERLQKEIVQRARDLEQLGSVERRLQTIIQESGDAIVITGRLLSAITMANRAFFELTGYHEEDVIGQNVFDFTPAMDMRYETVLGEEFVADERIYNIMLTKMLELDEHGRVAGWDFPLLDSSGQVMHLEANAACFYKGQDEQEGTVIIIRDVANRIITQRNLEGTTDFLANIIDNSPDGIMITDTGGHIINANHALLECVGYELDELLCQTPAIFSAYDEGDYTTTEGEHVRIGTEYLERGYDFMTNFLEHGTASNVLFYFKRKDGLLVEVEQSLAKLYSKNGSYIGAIGSIRDMTMRRRMEKKLEQQRDQLAAANRELESFAYSVSHDLRAPLRSISGFSTALEEDFRDILPPEGKHYLERIRAASGRMSLLIDDLLKLSRLTRYDMRREKVDLSALASDIAAQLHEQAPGRAVAWVVQPALTAYGDGHLLRILLENLIGNAWKYTGTRDRAEIFFGIAADTLNAPEHARGKIIYCVRDNGVGFNMAYADKLFGAFQRLHTDREFPGTGIGLATVQRIVHRHGGRAWAYAVPDGGAAFYFTLT